MSRSRNIKPGFFKNEVLAELPFEYRLLYIGTWTCADREGRFEDRPKKIKMELFSADDVDVDAGLQALHDKGFLLRYSDAGRAFCQILAWARHQNPHHREQQSNIPAPGKPEACPGLDSDKPGASPVQAVLIPDSLIPDSLNLIPPSRAIEQQAARSTAKRADRFEEFWVAYPVKKGRTDALKTWKTKNLDAITDAILADVRKRLTSDRQWLDGFIPHGSTYINRRGWEDAIEPVRGTAGQQGDRPLSAVERVRAANAAAEQRERGVRRESVAERAERYAREGDAREAAEQRLPRINADFTHKRYVGTPIDQLSPELRAGIEAQLAAHGAEESHAA